MFRTICHGLPDRRVHNIVCFVTVLLITTLIQLDTTDISHSIVNTTIWSSLEPCLGIVIACLPVLQPTVAKISGKGTLAWARRPSKTSAAPGT